MTQEMEELECNRRNNNMREMYQQTKKTTHNNNMQVKEINNEEGKVLRYMKKKSKQDGRNILKIYYIQKMKKTSRN